MKCEDCLRDAIECGGLVKDGYELVCDDCMGMRTELRYRIKRARVGDRVVVNRAKAESEESR